MSLRALLFRRPPDPQLIEIPFDGAIYSIDLRRHRQARRYTLRVQAATRSLVLTMPLRGSGKEARAFAERNGGWAAARSAASDRASRRARHGVDRARRRHAAALRRGRPCAPRAPRARFFETRGAARSGNREPPLRGAAWRHGPARCGTRSGEPLGLLHGGRCTLIFMAADLTPPY